MTPEEQRILLSMLGQAGGQTYSGLPKGVTTAGLNRQFDPRSLFLGGGVSTETIDQGIADAYAGLMDIYNTKVAGPSKYEASDSFLNAIPNKWATIGGSSLAVTDYFKTAFDELYAGRVTPQAMKDKIGDAPAEVQALFKAQPQVYADFETFAKNAVVYDNALAEQEYNRGQNATTVGPAPTMTDARAKYYTDAGAPEMALLPDPSAAYQFDPSTFIDDSTGQYTDAQRRFTNEQDTLARMLSGAQGSSAIQNNKLAESYRMKALQAEALKYAQAQTSGMDTTESAGDAAKNIFGSALRKAGIGAAAGGVATGALALPLAPIGAFGGALTFGVPELAGNLVDWFQGDYNKDERAKQDAATQLVYAKQLAKLQSGYTPLTSEQALLRYNPEAALVNSRMLRAKSDVSRTESDAQLLSQLISAKLSAAGRSPYADAVNAALRKS